MNLWTFFCVIIIIGVTGDALKKAFQGSRSGRDAGIESQKIKELARRISELENRTNFNEIEKRLQALESIVVDEDYVLDRKFKKAFGKNNDLPRQQAEGYL